MIRIEIDRGKTEVEIAGILPVIYSEITWALKEICDAIAEKIGEEAAKKCIKRIAELAVMDDKDLVENTQKKLEEKPELGGLANFIFDMFMK